MKYYENMTQKLRLGIKYREYQNNNSLNKFGRIGNQEFISAHTLVPLIVVYTRLLFFGKNFRGSTFIRVYMFITWDRNFTLYMFIRDYMFITLDRILNLLSHNIT